MQISKPFILFFSPARHAKAACEELQQVARVELVTSTNSQEFFKDVKDNKYKDTHVNYRTSACSAVAGNFDVEFIQQTPLSNEEI